MVKVNRKTKHIVLDGVKYGIAYVKKYHGMGRMEVYEVRDGNSFLLPMTLNWTSKFKAFLRDDLWPPLCYSSFFVGDSGNISILYSELIPFDTFAVNSINHPSEWLAEYNMQKQKWNLNRLRFLDVKGDKSGTPPQE